MYNSTHEGLTRRGMARKRKGNDIGSLFRHMTQTMRREAQFNDGVDE